MTIPPTSGQSLGAARPPFSIRTVQVSAIAIPAQATPINEAVVESLTLSIKRTGILNPLLVAALPNSDAFLLVAGTHRLEVARRLGITQVPVIVRSGEVHEIEMDQLEENLARKELSFLERAFQEKRLQELYIQHYPDTIRGLAGALARHGRATENLSFADQTARPGSGPKTIRNRINLASRIGPETAAILYGTPTAHKLGELTALSKLSSEQRPQVAKLLAEGRAKKVEEATAMAFNLPILVRPPKATKTTVPLEGADSGRSAVASLMGRKIVVTVHADGASVTLEDTGPASPHRGYTDDRSLLRTDELSAVLSELVAELPSRIAQDIVLEQPKVNERQAEIVIRTKYAGTEKTRGMLLWWWLEGGTDMDGILQPGSTPASSIPVKASLLGSPTIGQFRREFRNFFSRYVLVSTHRITDAFAQIEKMSSDATLKAKGPRKARSPAGPTIAKSPNRPEVVEQQLRYALRMQGFSPKPIRGAVAHLKSRIDNGETLAILLVDAIQFLTPEAATKK